MKETRTKFSKFSLAGLLSALAIVSGCSSSEDVPHGSVASTGGNQATGSGGQTSVPGSGGASAGTGGTGGVGEEVGPYSLEITTEGASSSCSLSPDSRSLMVSVKNTAATDSPVRELLVETLAADGSVEYSSSFDVPSMLSGEEKGLMLDRGAVAGFRETWDYRVSLDGGDAGAQTLLGTCVNPLRERARLAMAVLQSDYDQPSGLYDGTHWWSGANMLEVTLDYTRELGDASYLASVDNTFEKQKGGNFINEFYDDEGWWALAWLRAYDLTGQQKYLDMAKVLFDDIASSWDPGHCGGGVYWKKETDAKTAISNGLFFQIAVRLHQRTPGDEGPGSYIDWAWREWNWFKDSGLLRSDFLVIDSLDFATCAPGWDASFTYNQGVFIGGLVDLWRATGDDSLLDMATTMADATIAAKTNDEGILIESDCYPNCDAGDGLVFKGVLARNLAYLYEAVPLAKYRDFLVHQSDAIWTNNRSDSDELGQFWPGPFDGKPSSARQSAALDAIVGAVRVADMNLAIGAEAIGSAPCAANEGPERAIDGNVTSKWCAPGAGDQSLTVDLGAELEVVGFVVHHASSNGEDAAWNTGAFEIAVSSDGTNFTDVVTVTENTEGVTRHYVPLTGARYARLHISQAESTATGGAARILDFEVLGMSRAPL